MRRRFIDFPDGTGQLHVREHTPAGNEGKTPLVLLHAAPGSALMLAPLQERFARPTIAIDLPGMGDSSPLEALDRDAAITDFTAPVAVGLATLGFKAFDVYATLSGVRVALELATTTSLPIRKLILDGIGLPRADQLGELLEHYAPAFVPDINGTHLLNTFLLCRDQYLFYPWYARDAEHRRPNGLPNAEALHVKTMEALKSAAAFRPLIHAAFRYDCAAKLKALKQPALISGDGAAVRPDYPVLTEPPAEPLTATSENLDKRAAQMNAFLDG
jgi:pimeloyl-ACP methyl ester carboxylesterase